MNTGSPSRHLLNVYNCKPETLQTIQPVRQGLEQALEHKVVSTVPFFYQFESRDNPGEPCGVTGFYLGAGEHVSIHTWPEREMAALDVVGNYGLKRNLVNNLQRALPAQYVQIGKKSRVTEKVGQEVVGALIDIPYSDKVEHQQALLSLLKDISQQANFTVVGEICRGDEQYLDAAVILSESHFSVHYNRKQNRIDADIFTCGKEGDPEKGYALLQHYLRATSAEFNRYIR